MQNEGTPELRRLCILIVEDESAIATALGFLLEDAGYKPLFAASGREALLIVTQQPVAVVITDLMMPIMSGGELILTLRARFATEQLPALVVMTAAGKDYAQGSGADYLLEKPFALEEVEALLQQLFP